MQVTPSLKSSAQTMIGFSTTRRFINWLIIDRLTSVVPPINKGMPNPSSTQPLPLQRSISHRPAANVILLVHVDRQPQPHLRIAEHLLQLGHLLPDRSDCSSLRRFGGVGEDPRVGGGTARAAPRAAGSTGWAGGGCARRRGGHGGGSCGF